MIAREERRRATAARYQQKRLKLKALIQSPSTDEEARLAALLKDEIARNGPMPFSRFMERCLYAPGLGYYSAGRTKFGAAGDFVTAPELGDLFAQTYELLDGETPGPPASR